MGWAVIPLADGSFVNLEIPDDPELEIDLGWKGICVMDVPHRDFPIAESLSETMQ